MSRLLSILTALSLILPLTGCDEASSTGRTSAIEMRRVSSSAIAAVGYSEKMQELVIRFTNGKKYSYLDVPPSVYKRLMSASSKGRHFNQNIRYQYSSHVK